VARLSGAAARGSIHEYSPVTKRTPSDDVIEESIVIPGFLSPMLTALGLLTRGTAEHIRYM
jgi:hypothetical protein